MLYINLIKVHIYKYVETCHCLAFCLVSAGTLSRGCSVSAYWIICFVFVYCMCVYRLQNMFFQRLIHIISVFLFKSLFSFKPHEYCIYCSFNQFFWYFARTLKKQITNLKTNYKFENSLLQVTVMWENILIIIVKSKMKWLFINSSLKKRELKKLPYIILSASKYLQFKVHNSHWHDRLVSVLTGSIWCYFLSAKDRVV